MLEQSADVPTRKLNLEKLEENKQREAARQELQTQFEKDHPFENALVNVVKPRKRPFGQTQ